METALIFVLMSLFAIAVVLGTIFVFVWVLLNFEVE
jgi:hypothetical protein